MDSAATKSLGWGGTSDVKRPLRHERQRRCPRARSKTAAAEALGSGDALVRGRARQERRRRSPMANRDGGKDP